MELLQIIAVCIVCLPVILLVKKTAPEHGLLLTMAVVLVVVAGCLALVAPVMERLRTLFEQAGLESSCISVLLKTLAAATVTRLCSDICRDGGSQAMASVVELAGAGASLLIALPLLEEVTELLRGFFT